MTTYEWDIETVDAESDDIIDHNHRDRLAEFGMDELIRAINQDIEPGNNYTRLVLVRDRRASDGDLICRSWAYVTDGKLPDQFMDASDHPVAKVPQRFIKEFAR